MRRACERQSLQRHDTNDQLFLCSAEGVLQLQRVLPPGLDKKRTMAASWRWWAACVAVLLLVAAGAAVAHADEVVIETTFMPDECTVKAKNGDNLQVHYRGKLTSGKQFDASYDRNQPLPVRLGSRQVITGWEEGLQGMCLGEKRTLTIPPSKGYGSRGVPNIIPPDATLIFETELVAVNGQTYTSQ